MSLREYIYNVITTDIQLNALGITANSTFTTHTVDTPQVRPLCIIRWLNVVEGLSSGDLSRVNHRTCQVWVHDDLNRGEYDRVDASLKRLRDVLTNVRGVNVGSPGAWLSTIDWEGDSDDLNDDALHTLMRYAQFRLTGSAI